METLALMRDSSNINDTVIINDSVESREKDIYDEKGGANICDDKENKIMTIKPTTAKKTVNLIIKDKPQIAPKKVKLTIVPQRKNLPPIEQTWSIKKIVTEHVPYSWEKVYRDSMPELEDIDEILSNEEKVSGRYYPLKKDIFRAFELTPLHHVKVVIVGQDPYHDTIYNGMPRAVGLSFSVDRSANLPPSLRNIYREIKRSIPSFVEPNHGDLTEWANQGVLLLNTCLTVKPRCPGSHGEIWLGFINKVINAISEVNPHCIYLLWGRPAQSIDRMLPGTANVLTSAHPSGRNDNKNIKDPFVGNNHFVKTNEILISQKKTPINWQITP